MSSAKLVKPVKADIDRKIVHSVSMRQSHKSSVRVPWPTSTWRDPRLIIGIFLIVVSIVGVSVLVSTARAGIPIYQASRDIAAGEPLNASNVSIVSARPGADVYVTDGEELTGSYAKHSLRQGELIARSAVTTREEESMRTFLIVVDDGLPEGVHVGDHIEMWFVPDSLPSETAPPQAQRIDADVTLVRVIGQSTGLGVSAGTRVEIRADAEHMANLLTYTHAQGKLIAVPVGAQ